MSTQQYTGGCMCGAIRYELNCESPWSVSVSYTHLTLPTKA